jgi:glycosyltransferase involved in cell wall biosynthesis
MYCTCDMWIAASKNEGFGLPVLEAMACGVPVIWHPTLGLRDLMVDGENCLITDDTTLSVVQAVRRLYKSPSLRDKLRDNGLKLAAQFTWEKTAKEFSNAIEAFS